MKPSVARILSAARAAVAQPVKHLHLLELMYLCLSLGFEGKYRVMPRGTLELEVIRDSLYRQIRQLRGDVPSEISPHWQGLQGERGQFVRAAPWWAVTLFTLLCLGVIYGGFSWVLREQRQHVLQEFVQGSPVSLADTTFRDDLQ